MAAKQYEFRGEMMSCKEFAERARIETLIPFDVRWVQRKIREEGWGLQDCFDNPPRTNSQNGRAGKKRSPWNKKRKES